MFNPLLYSGIAGRNGEDVASTFIQALRHPDIAEAEHVTIWADNCTAQNKNWVLSTAIANEMMSPLNKHKTVTLKYFIPGHSFMSADSFHKQVEDTMKHPATKTPDDQSKGCVYDYNDFSNVMVEAGGQVHEMQPTEFLTVPNAKSERKWTHYPLLEAITVLQFRQWSTKMYWKTSFDEATFQQGEFLQKRYLDTYTEFENRKEPRGLDPQKLADIQKKLCKMMPLEKRSFWNNMPSNPDSLDLTRNYDEKIWFNE